jgi:uncharacterized protein involved in oxidation of intracellular sulfur
MIAWAGDLERKNGPRLRENVNNILLSLVTGNLQKGEWVMSREKMKVLFIISTDDSETIYNAMRLANVAIKKGDEVSVFMLGKGVLFEKCGNEQFNVMGEVNSFKGDFYV